MMTEVQKEWAELWRLSDEVVKEIERFVYRIDGRGVKLKYKPIDQIRLLRLVVWARRYSITIEQLLDMVVPVFWSQIKRKGHGLGIKAATLVSNGTERILGEELVKRYPNGENVTGWKHQERLRQIDREQAEEGIRAGVPGRNILEYNSVLGFVEQYRKTSEAARDTYRAAVNSRRRRYKPYRFNPWR